MGNEEGRVQDSDPIVLRRQLTLLGPYVAPRTATERKLAEIWRNARGMDQIGIADGYEDLGGDSLRAAGILPWNSVSFSAIHNLPNRPCSCNPATERGLDSNERPIGGPSTKKSKSKPIWLHIVDDNLVRNYCCARWRTMIALGPGITSTT